jgi:hypothetical protein
MVDSARSNCWTPEQFIVAVKTACYTAPAIANMATTSERDSALSVVVTACIKQYFADGKS